MFRAQEKGLAWLGAKKNKTFSNGLYGRDWIGGMYGWDEWDRLVGWMDISETLPKSLYLWVSLSKFLSLSLSLLSLYL